MGYFNNIDQVAGLKKDKEDIKQKEIGSSTLISD
jgi:hypothetical protein